MAVSEIRRISIVAHHSIREELIQELQGRGVVQISDLREDLGQSELKEFLSPGELRDEDLEERRSELRQAIDYIGRFEERKGLVKSLLTGMVKSKILFDQDEFLHTIENFDYQEICKACQKLERDIKDLKSKMGRRRVKYGELLPWENLDILLEEVRDTKRTKVVLGFIENRSLPAMIEEVKGASPQIFWKALRPEGRLSYLLIIYLKDFHEKVSEIFTRFGLTAVSFPKLKGKVKENLEEISNDLKEMEAQKEVLLEESKKLNAVRHRLMALYDHLSNQGERKNIQNLFLSTKEVFMIEGWIRERDEERIRKLEKSHPEIEIRIRDPLPDENPPIDLENRRAVKPFEMVTNLYGLPCYTEIDPTPLFAPFFALFFALCLTDAGYGLILSLGSWLALKKLKIGAGGRKLFQLLLIGGLVTILIGIFTGGLFGIQFDALPESWTLVRAIRNKLMLFDPLKNIQVFLLLSLALGFIHVWFGFLVKLIKIFRRGRKLEAIQTQLPWLIFLPGLLFFALTKIKGLGQSAVILSNWIVGLSGLGILLFHAGRTRNILKRLGVGFYGLLFVTKDVFSDILSYVRLTALGLATSVIAMSINMIASQCNQIPYHLGIIIMIPILIVGHLGNMAINALCGFIHTARLQFVEFFTKFYEGGGKPFKPFREENEYTVIKSGDFI